MTTVVANHSLSTISKYASHCKSNGGFVIQPPTFDNLYGLVHIESESKIEEVSPVIPNDENIEGEIVLEQSPEINQRFYVDETNMIERRFLADDTSKFKDKRDSDPFATSVLHDNILDCVWDCLNIQDNLRSLREKMFLNGVKNTENTKNTENMIVQIALDEWRKHSVESVRHAHRWKWDTMDETRAITLLWNMLSMIPTSNLSITYNIIAITSIIWSKTILVEKSSMGQWIEFGARPGKDSDQILWIREVPDGFLGVSSTAGVVREYTRRLKMTGQMYTSDTFISAEKQSYKVPTISGIQDILTKNGIKYNKKDKKPELIRALEQKLLWEIY